MNTQKKSKYETKSVVKSYKECVAIDPQYMKSLNVSPEYFDALYAGSEVDKSKVCGMGKLYDIGVGIVPQSFCKVL